MKKVKDIVIVGGGTAGWITALNLLNKTFCNITVVSSKEIPIIGVGESTTGKLAELIKVSNINEAELLSKTNSTYKLGIKHSNWHTKGESFWSPLGLNITNENNYPHRNYDLYRIFHVANELGLENEIISKCMQQSQMPRICYMDYFHIAYHIDTYKFGQYIKDELLKNNRVKHIEGVVDKVNKNSDGIKSLKVNNKNITGDLYIDCSGFKRLLIGNKHFKSYEDELLVNRAITFNIKDKILKNYTHAKAMNNGWMWKIPLQERKGCGYVFSDNHITPDNAKIEIENELGHEIEIQKDIKFNSGRIKNVWEGNVISTGLATGFVEPLEATSIHMTVIQINHFIENYFTHEMDFKVQQKQYNEDINVIWDDIKDFIRLHYISPRQDTSFWKDVSNAKISDSLKDRLDIWKSRMPRYADYGRNNFYDLGNTLWYQILMGMKLLDKNIAKKELEQFGLYDYAKELYENTMNLNNDVINKETYNNKEFHYHKKMKSSDPKKSNDIKDYFENIVRWPIDGCPLLEVKIPKIIHNEWNQWTEKYRWYKNHELGFLKEHLNEGNNSYQVTIGSYDLDKSFCFPFMIRLCEYYIHKTKNIDFKDLRKCCTVRNAPGDSDNDFWINYANKGDTNPIHQHAGDVSCVVYVKNTQDNPTYLKWYNSKINYECEDGYIIMFPSDMQHWVEEKITDEERITGSVNFLVNLTEKNK